MTINMGKSYELPRMRRRKKSIRIVVAVVENVDLGNRIHPRITGYNCQNIDLLFLSVQKNFSLPQNSNPFTKPQLISQIKFSNFYTDQTFRYRGGKTSRDGDMRIRAYSDSDAENFQEGGLNGHNFRHPLNFRHRYPIILLQFLVRDCLGRCLFIVCTNVVEVLMVKLHGYTGYTGYTVQQRHL